MMRMTRVALPLGVALLLAACGDDRDRAGNEAAEANAAADMNAMTADANNPFANAEMRNGGDRLDSRLVEASG